MRAILIGIVFIALLFGIFYGALHLLGAGGFKRMITLTGVYSVCKPDGYEVVCFLDADSAQGGLTCLPLSAVGGKCLK